MSLLEVRMSFIRFFLQACSNFTLEDVAIFGEYSPSGRNSSLNLLVLDFVSGVVSQSQVQRANTFLTYYAYHSLCIRPMVKMQSVLG